jgi:hypothetical protein
VELIARTQCTGVHPAGAGVVPEVVMPGLVDRCCLPVRSADDHVGKAGAAAAASSVAFYSAFGLVEVSDRAEEATERIIPRLTGGLTFSTTTIQIFVSRDLE